jgi:acyl-homoserine lactone acylase PvdQ
MKKEQKNKQMMEQAQHNNYSMMVNAFTPHTRCEQI